MDVNTRSIQLQTLKIAVQDVFNLYLGVPRSTKNEEPKDIERNVRTIDKQRVPKDNQFTAEFLRLKSQFPDHEQLRLVSESILASSLASCSGHTIQIEFLLFVLHNLLRLNLLNWDSFLPMLLKAATAIESSRQSVKSGVNSAVNGTSALSSHTTNLGSPQVPTAATPASPASAIVGSPPYSTADSSISQSPAKTTEVSLGTRATKVAAWLRQVVCKVILIALDTADLNPVTCFEALSQIVQWVNTKDAIGSGTTEEGKLYKFISGQQDSMEWIYDCLSVIKAFVDETKNRLPFYALLHDRTQLHLDHWPNDVVLFSFFLEVHRRREKISTYMQMLDQHLHCPTFATLRMVALTYQGAMGEPLHGEDVAASVPKGSIEWERALRCLRHGLCVIPSSDWWRRVLIAAPRYIQASSQPRPAFFTSSVPYFVFTAEMTCEAVVDRIMDLMQSLPKGTISSSQNRVGEGDRWQQWFSFADLFFFLVRHGFLDIVDFIDMLAARFSSSENHTVQSNHVTWLLAQVFRLETVTIAMNNDPRKVETTQKILSFHKEERPLEQNGTISPEDILLDLVSSPQMLRLWSMNRSMLDQSVIRYDIQQKIKQIDDWWQPSKERTLDFSNLDSKSMGMIWVLSHTMTQPVYDAMKHWMMSNGYRDIMIPAGSLRVMQETQPLPMNLLAGLSLHFCTRLIGMIEEQIFGGQMLPSIAMMETYARLLLIAPHTLFRCHVTGMMHTYQQSLGKSGTSISILELLNYRLLPLYRYHGKVKQLFYDIAKIIINTKGKRGEHRLFRLAENLCLNIILSLPEVVLVKKELKGASTEFTETLNRAMIMSLAVTIKTRGIAEFEQQFILAPAIDQILASSLHSWSEKTTRHFPALLREILAARPDKRSQTIQGWQQVEATMIHQCRQLLALTTDASHLLNYVSHMPPQHRQYLCAVAWILLDKHPESINTGNLSRVLKELSAEEVTLNVYTMVDVLLFNTQLHIQLGHSAQEVLYRVNSALAGLVWSHELFPFDILLLALADRDDDQLALQIVFSLLFDSLEFDQRVQNYNNSHGSHEHWLYNGTFQRSDPLKVLGGHLVGKDRFPVYFDDICVRMLPTLMLILYRFIENEHFDAAERLLDKYDMLFVHHPSRFTFVRDTLAYFYGSLPNKFIFRLLSNLDLTKTPFSSAFLQEHNLSDHLSSVLANIVNVVIPPLTRKVSPKSQGGLGHLGGQNVVPPSITSSVPENSKVFYQHQDPGTYPQLVLETAVIELLSSQFKPSQIVPMLVQIAVKIAGQSHLEQGHAQNASTSSVSQIPNPRSPLHVSSPPGQSVDSFTNVTSSASATASQNPVVSSPLMIQACGLLLSQLPTSFHDALYVETARILKECWWITDSNKTNNETDAAYAYSVWDPTWAIEEDTSTIIGNTVALLHAFASNLSFEWLDGIHSVINKQRPMKFVAQLRIAFRIIGPLLPRLVVSKPVFAKTLALLFTVLAEVLQQPTCPVDLNEISDLIDFMHHAVMLEGQVGGKPRPETLLLCSKAVDRLRPDLQPYFRHLSIDKNRSVYAATHPKLVQRPPGTI